jgi:protein gp37
MSKATSAEWFNVSWNPISGRCPNNCLDLEGQEYCWMWRPKTGIASRFKEKHEHALCLNEKILNHVPKTGRVLVGSSTDMFVDEVPEEWIKQVFRSVYRTQHLGVHYFFLTKKPERYKDLVKHEIYPPIFQWFGTTYDGTEKTKDNVEILKSLVDTASNTKFEYRKFVSFEPLLADPTGLDLSGIKWIIIGADSRKGKPKPPERWADYLIAEARRVGAMVLVKDNYGYSERIKEMPGVN